MLYTSNSIEPSRKLSLHDLTVRLWRVIPPRLRREALFSTMELLAPRPSHPVPMPSLPVTVAGYFAAPSGLGEGARRLADMLEAVGCAVHRADLTAALRQSVSGPAPAPGPVGPGTLILHVNGPMVPWAMHALGKPAVRGKRVFGFWNWELPRLPVDWDRGYKFVHGVLASSKFVADAVYRPGGPPVHVVHYPVPDPAPKVISRSDLGLPEQGLIFLSIFDAASSVERKNPIAVVRAHRAAFGDCQKNILLLKTHNTAMGGTAWQEVKDAAANFSNIHIIEKNMSRSEIWGLIRLSDVFVSLHRSEGVGLSMLEAMRLGRPVIATGWSGNLDFMENHSAFLIGYRFIDALDERGTYSVPGSQWAEPEVTEAAAAMRLLADDASLRFRIGCAGRQRVADLTLHECGLRALRALCLTNLTQM